MSVKPTVIIFGASEGIGRGIAVHLARKNEYKLALLSRNIAKLTETKKLCKSVNNDIKTLILSCDISKQDDVKRNIDRINDTFGPISSVVNSAGTFFLHQINADFPLNKIDEQIDVDLKGLMYSCMYTIPYIKKTKKLYPNISCNVIVLSGRSATYRGLPAGFALYVSVLCGKRGFMDVLHKELKPFGIKSCCIMPGIVNTKMSNKYYKYKEQAIQINDIGYIVNSVINTPHTCVPSEIVLEPQYDGDTKSDVFIKAKL
mmetsp:Transcript_28304/g.34596  ORF Transcript_28304/g.34596 Transcript_28304/m.34596 type:complete len:259 (-) Transcript_28304:79-855(-)